VGHGVPTPKYIGRVTCVNNCKLYKTLCDPAKTELIQLCVIVVAALAEPGPGLTGPRRLVYGEKTTVSDIDYVPRKWEPP
jgi:hypothetical protein